MPGRARKFQSTLPVWGETAKSGHRSRRYAHFNPLSPCGERQPEPDKPAEEPEISIHSPRVGRDFLMRSAMKSSEYFNPLSPCGERPCSKRGTLSRSDFNPLSPCGERQQTHTAFQQEKLSYLHNIEANSAAGSFFLPGKICFFKEIRSFFRASRTEKGWELLPRTGYEEHQIISTPSAS